MRNIAVVLCVLLIFSTSFSQQAWAPVKRAIASQWAEKLDVQHPLPDYPRPQLVRDNWKNLNGLWNYTILPITDESIPTIFQGKLLVPFPVESSLSGVGKTVGKDSVLWYQQSFTLPTMIKGRDVLLHFGAVDWQCDVYVNGKKAGRHEGGYDPFSFNITPLLTATKNQQVLVRVWDPSDDGPQPRGKQVKKPSGIWYTPVTGIWQTVWMETVPHTYIVSTRQVPDIDKHIVHVSAASENKLDGDQIIVSAWNGTEKIGEKIITTGNETDLEIPSQKLWSPDHPFLYDLRISITRKGKIIDEVKSYFAMRKMSVGQDSEGIQRMLLNNQFVFQIGPLDQGWWPDGLYTAPTEEALVYDIDKTKDMGFNLIRKHVKVEPARWYYHCDQAGMLVWQDMPSGDLGNRWENRPGVYGRATDKERTPASEKIYRTEWNAIMESLQNFPCIVVWTPFNEAWGQFKTKDIVQWTMQKDPSRLVNTASGGNFEDVGPIMDLHNYPEPLMPDPLLFGNKRVLVLGEFGGLGLAIENHTWQDKNNWGYQTFKTREDLLARYTELMNRIPLLIEKGLSAAVYTQTTDVEVETNGLMTYDRREMKMPAAALKALHATLYEAAQKHVSLQQVTINN